MIILVLLFFVGVSVAEYQKYIVGGIKSMIQEFPYQASVRVKYQGHICGGAIISKKHILTAAHCVLQSPDFIKPVPSNTLEVRVGSTFSSKKGQIFDVDKIIASYFNVREFKNDIALLKLKRNLKWSDRVRPVNLPAANQNFKTGTKVIATGWGQNEFGNNVPHLSSVSLMIFEPEMCRFLLKNIIKLKWSEDYMCAGGYDVYKKRNVCKGDSGGPLVTEGRTLIGIVSLGFGCGSEPAIFANVAHFRKWIDRQING